MFSVSDVLQMMGRAGRPQFDDQGFAVILVHDVKKHFYKKFIYEPFPVESRYNNSQKCMLLKHVYNVYMMLLGEGLLSVKTVTCLLPSSPLSEQRRYCVARHPSVMLSRCVCIRHIGLGGEGNVLYPVLSSLQGVPKK